ncbi:MAG: cbb3-type cytochrome c oxidase N-terminal domain-containing protein [Gemmatimonas sp.]
MTEDNRANDEQAAANNSGRPIADRILEHSYDGIQEYDNPMPRWWLLTFAGTVIFAIIYLFNIGPIGNGRGRIADYEAELKAFALAHPPSENATVSAGVLLALTTNKSALELGKATFTTNCVACHRADGGGVIGPNLTDKFWLHGGALTDIYRTIANGVLDKGMPPWAKMLKPEQVKAVTAYVASLQGTNPANPKAAQGVAASP